jgi:hypothetical protein
VGGDACLELRLGAGACDDEVELGNPIAHLRGKGAAVEEVEFLDLI